MYLIRKVITGSTYYYKGYYGVWCFNVAIARRFQSEEEARETIATRYLGKCEIIQIN